MSSSSHYFVVVFMPQERCFSQTVPVSGAEGYIASSTTEETQCGSVNAPYVIQVAETQRINITLMDFSYR